MIGLDYETFAKVDLKTRGLDNYIRDPEFRVLLAAVAWRGSDGYEHTKCYDFVFRPNGINAFRTSLASASVVAAHNAGFERAVTKKLDILDMDEIFFDTAVVARTEGAGQKLEVAAPQLLGVDKLPDGRRLIKKFSMPLPDGRVMVADTRDWTQEDHDDWTLFKEYCELDALLSFRLAEGRMFDYSTAQEAITQSMNDIGWFVDMPVVHEMQARYLRNLADLERWFRINFDEQGELNFRSTAQLRKWCMERGMRTTSFDEAHVKKMLRQVSNEIDRVNRQRASATRTKRLDNLRDIRAMLSVKQDLGGSSLSKLQKIIDTVGPDGRLRNQYLHAGAGQTHRTSGRGVQLQNVKRLGSVVLAVEDLLLDEPGYDWDNNELARNLRQVFRAEHPDGQLIVGDFSSVESRGLAYLAGARWKLDAFRRGQDMYKVLASSMLGIPYESIAKSERQTGKVGELSCGYGAGPQAVKDFAEKMGVVFTLEEAGDIVHGWRDTNPEVVRLWEGIDQALHDVVEKGAREQSLLLGPNQELRLTFVRGYTPDSVKRTNPSATTVEMLLRVEATGRLVMRRVFQGCFMDGRDICYMKPSELKSGGLWLTKWFKDGREGRYKLYGGKLTGILVQSFCRELFFHSLRDLTGRFRHIDNIQIIGQFHDEIVVEWQPGDLSLDRALALVERSMTDVPAWAQGFPLEADVKHDRRYTK